MPRNLILAVLISLATISSAQDRYMLLTIREDASKLEKYAWAQEIRKVLNDSSTLDVNSLPLYSDAKDDKIKYRGVCVDVKKPGSPTPPLKIKPLDVTAAMTSASVELAEKTPAYVMDKVSDLDKIVKPESVKAEPITPVEEPVK